MIAQRLREKFYMWRKDTVDIAYGWLSADDDYEKSIESAIFDILYLYQRHIRAPYNIGDTGNWMELLYRTTEIVAYAAELSIMMRRCRNGTWSPFIPIRGQTALPAAVMRHQDVAASLPPGQAVARPDSRVTMTVVPGLCKYEMQPAPEDPAQPGVAMTRIVKRVRMRAKCLIDLTETEVGPLLEGDIQVAEDL